MNTTAQGIIIILSTILAIGFLSTALLWMKAKIQGWQFVAQFTTLNPGNYTFRPLSFGVYNTGWFTARAYGDGTPDPKKPGHMIPNQTQKRNRQFGFDIILIKWCWVVAIVKDEQR